MHSSITSASHLHDMGEGDAARPPANEMSAKRTCRKSLDAAAQASTEVEDEPQPTGEGNNDAQPPVGAAAEAMEAQGGTDTQNSGKTSTKEVQGVKSREAESSSVGEKEEVEGVKSREAKGSAAEDEEESDKDEAGDDGSSQGSSTGGNSFTSAATDPGTTLQAALDAAQDAFSELTAQLKKSCDKKTQELLSSALEKMTRAIERAQEAAQSAQAAVSKEATALTAQLDQPGEKKTQEALTPALEKMARSMDKAREATQSTAPKEASAAGKVRRPEQGATSFLSTSRPPSVLQAGQTPVPRKQGSVSGPDQLALARSQGRPIPPAVLELLRPKSKLEKLDILSKQATWEFYLGGKAVKQWQKRCRVLQPEGGTPYRQTAFITSPDCGEPLHFPTEKATGLGALPLTWDLHQQRTITNAPEGLAHMNMMLVHDSRHARAPASERLPRPTMLRSIRNWHDEKAMRAAGKPLDKWTTSELREHRL